MIDLISSSLSIARCDEDGDREVTLWLEIDNRVEVYIDSAIDVDFVAPNGDVRLRCFIQGGPVALGRQVVRFTTWECFEPEALDVRWRLRLRAGKWVGPVRAARQGPSPAREEPPVDDAWLALDRDGPDVALRLFSRHEIERQPGPVDLRRLAEMGSSDDPRRVELACRIAAAAGWREFSKDLRRALRHPDPAVRAEAAQALGTLAEHRAELDLRRLLKDPDVGVRGAAQRALEACGLLEPNARG